MKCKQIKSNGVRCDANSTKDGEYCFRHNPANKEAGILASTKGGQNRRLQGVYGETVELNKPRDAEKLLAQVINSVWTGKIPVQVGTSMAFLAKCWLEAHTKAEKEDDPYGLGRFQPLP